MHHGRGWGLVQAQLLLEAAELRGHGFKLVEAKGWGLSPPQLSDWTRAGLPGCAGAGYLALHALGTPRLPAVVVRNLEYGFIPRLQGGAGENS